MTAPSKIGTSVLIGTGVRSVKLGFVEISVYSLGLYVDPVSCQNVLASYEGSDHNSLLCNPSFYSDFASGLFRKTFRISFCRTIGRDKLVGGFDGPLRARCDASHMVDAEKMLSNLVPCSGVMEGDVLSICCHEDGETINASFREAATGNENALLNMPSGGEGGVWLAFQNLYFDDNTAIPTIRHNATSGLPNVLLVRQEDASGSFEILNDVQKMPSEKEIQEAVELDLAKAGQWTKAKTWSEFAGREASNEDTGYKFGDLTLGVVSALGIRKPKTKSATRSIISENSTKIERLRKELSELQSTNAKIQGDKVATQAALHRSNELLSQSQRSLPLKVICSLALIEILSISTVYITGLSPSKLSVGKILLCIFGSGISWALNNQEATTAKAKQQ
mmetsp:Transcript_22453/g.34080  ORF Transcript_22453/g.34080 Transcript_22453/m.34080 type:complete len:393 (+) Transcript_22453:106-1284(+)